MWKVQDVKSYEVQSNWTRDKEDELLCSQSTVSSVIDGLRTCTICSARAKCARWGVRGKSIQSNWRYSRKVHCGSIATMLTCSAYDGATYGVSGKSVSWKLRYSGKGIMFTKYISLIFLTDRKQCYTFYIVHSPHYRDRIHDTKPPKCTNFSWNIYITYYNTNI